MEVREPAFVAGSRPVKPSSMVAHPVLFGVVPVLSLYSKNWRLVPPGELLLATAGSLALLALAWLAAHLAYRNILKSGLVVSVFLLGFYFYGLAYRRLFDPEAVADSRGRHGLLLTLFLVLVLAAGRAVAKLGGDLGRANLILNVVGLVAVSMPLAVSLAGVTAHVLAARRAPEEGVELGAGQRFPDIYYIVPDAYARSDVLRRVFDHDNREFLDFLTGRGFHVDHDSVSNYNQTYLSLASSLNFAYLQDIEPLAKLNGSRAVSRIPLRMLIYHSRVIESLKKLGYAFVTFPSGYHATSFDNADILVENRWTPSEFQDGLIAMTPIPGLLALLAGRDQYDWHRQRVLNVLENLDHVAGELRQPVFVFAHLFSPHPPFVFDAKGGASRASRPFTTDDGSHFFVRNGGTVEEYVDGYTDQVAFLNRRLAEAVDRILEKSQTPPIIIIQSDHGSGFRMHHESLEKTDLRERFPILNALFLPGFEDGELPAGLSPVNIFRIVLNRYFGAELELLEDRSYFAAWSTPYRYVDVTDRLHD